MRSVLYSTMNKMVTFSEDTIAWGQTVNLPPEAIWRHSSLFPLWAFFCVTPEILRFLVLCLSPSLSCQCCCHMKREEFSLALDVSLNTTRSGSAGKKPACCFHSCWGQGCQLWESCHVLPLLRACSGTSSTKPSRSEPPIHETFQREPFTTAHNIPNYNSELISATLTLYKMRHRRVPGAQVRGKLTPRAHLRKDSAPLQAPALCDTTPSRVGRPPVPSALPARLGAECPPHPHLAGTNPQNSCVQHRLLSLATSCQETDPARWWLSIPIEVLYILSLPLLYNLFLQFSLPLVLCKTMHLNNNTDNISSSDKGTEISSSDVTTFLSITEVS